MSGRLASAEMAEFLSLPLEFQSLDSSCGLSICSLNKEIAAQDAQNH